MFFFFLSFKKEEDEIKHEMSNFIIETTSYESQFSEKLEDDKSPLVE